TSSAVARTPTSPAMSASSSRSQSASSPGSKDAAAASSPVSARRDFESESRSREKSRPPLSSSTGSGAASGSPSSRDQLRGDLPLLVADERHLGTVRQDRIDLELRPPDHEVDVDVRDVHPLVRLSVERIRDPESVGDVAGRVLVEERVVEERARLAD